MNNKSRVLKNIEVKSSVSGVNRIQVSLYYSLGGFNHFTGKVDPRGYSVSVMPQEVSRGYTSTQVFGGVKQFIEETSRFSKAKLNKLEIGDDIINHLVDHVVHKNKLEIIETVEA